VTYDVMESLKVVDYAYFISDGVLVAEGTPAEIAASRDPFVRQFVDCLPDGPVAFHYPSRAYASDLGVNGAGPSPQT
jgi:phospholipid/cholesterol/gamma-HCH transport system ATP-binding protein